jgi:peptide/nickel transport system substrate-binding protein
MRVAISAPDDVAYCLQRGLLQDRSGGPQWVLLDPILGVTAIDDLAKEVGDVKACEKVKEAISVQGDNVVIKLRIPFAPMLQILAGTWGAVLDKEWMIQQGDWDGKCDNWRKWHDPAAEKSTIFNRANGTGPYKLEKWTPNEEIRFVRFDGHWRGPAKTKNAVIKVVPEWGTRLAMFQAGDADIIAVPRAFVAQMDPLVKAGNARMYKDLPTNTAQDAFFNFKVEEKSPFVPLLGRDTRSPISSATSTCARPSTTASTPTLISKMRGWARPRSAAGRSPRACWAITLSSRSTSSTWGSARLS